MTGSEYARGCNFGRVLSITRFLVCQVSVYARVAQGSEYAWIWLNNALWLGSGYAFHRVLNKLTVLNMLGLRIWQGCEYAKVTQGPEYAWISLNMSYEWICLNRFLIYLKKQSAEYARIQNVSDKVHSISSLYKLLSSYRDRRVFKTLSSI